MAKYIGRSVGYLIKLLVMLATIYAVMFYTRTAGVSAAHFLRELFSEPRGWMLLGALVVLAGVYPLFGFVSRTSRADIAADREKIIAAMHAAGYIATGDEPERMTFRAGSPFKRLWAVFEDKVTVRRAADGIVIDGMRKGVVDAVFRLNTYMRNES